MKTFLVLLAALALVVPTFAVKKQKEKVRIEVVSQAEEQGVRVGSKGSIVGRRTFSEVFMVNAIINGDKARLKCFENHRGCTALGPGFYDAEVEGYDIWISIQMPITHQVVRDHWKVSGTWGTSDNPAQPKPADAKPVAAAEQRDPQK